MPDCYAHSLPDKPVAEWEGLAAHASAVAEMAAAFADVFGWGPMARTAGLLHDAGKASAEFQAYLRGDGGSVNHSSWGACVATERYGGDLGRMLALVIAGHHAGLADAEDLDRRLAARHTLPNASGWPGHADTPAKAALAPSKRLRPSDIAPLGFGHAFLVRMLFSCLVDADFLATEAFMSGGAVRRGVAVGLDVLEARLIAEMAKLRQRAKPGRLNDLRNEILEAALAKAGAEPGWFTLTVPTGGGKTLASLRFALAHARAHGKRRVIYVIPYTAIIEQTADVFRKAVGDDAVLEHHSSFDWENAGDRLARADGGDARDRLGPLRLAAENWDAPVVVTTAVQFFESLFAKRTSSCRKLHNIADSVVVLDEAQTLPVGLLRPCLAALEELQRNYGVSPVLCTATQPAWRRQDGALKQDNKPFGLDIPEDRELAPRPQYLYETLRRVAVEVRPGATSDATIAARFAEAERMLCIVNSRAHARALFDRIAALPGAVHLTTLMCPAHRRAVLATLRQRLKDQQPVRLVATSLIEAGVDISFPEVWRAVAGVDSVAQAAGRCNREGELLPALGRVVVFTPEDDRPPRTLKAFAQTAQGVLRDHADDPLSLAAVRAYFAQLYFQKGAEALDATRIEGRNEPGVLAALHATAPGLRFPFESIAGAFRMIDETMRPVVVPWDKTAEAALDAVAHAERPPRQELRRLQQYTVGLPRQVCADWLAAGVITPVRRDLGDALLRFHDLAHYRKGTGVDLSNPTWRAAEDNLV